MLFTISKDIFNDKNIHNKALQVIREIKILLHQFDVPNKNAFPLIPYLLFKASLYNNPIAITFNSFLNGKLEIDDDVRFLARETLNDALWNRLLELVTKYSAYEFALAVLIPVTTNELDRGLTTPSSIIKLVHKILNVSTGDKVADVCCGSGSYIVSAANENPNAFYYGYEINIANKAAAMMKAELLGVDINVTLCDVFTLPDSAKMQKFDKIFSNYPFGLKLRNLGAGVEYFKKKANQYPGFSKGISSDWVFNSLLCDLLSEDGKAISIMTNGSTWNSIDQSIRKYFIENKLVECVIALPSRMFVGTSISTTLIVLSHNNDTVRMIDATKQCHYGRRQNEFDDDDIEAIIKALDVDSEFSKCISIDDLRRNEYTLNLSRYVTEEINIKNGVPFESIIKSISRGAPCTAKQLDEMVSNSVTNMQYLMISNIQDGIIDDKLPYLSYIDPKYERYCLKNNSLILSKNGLPYKIAVASVKEGQHILANGNLYIIELDENKANPYYVKAFFESELGHAVLKSITVGDVMPNIGVDKLKKLEIPIPSMEEQNRIAKMYQSTLDEISVIKLRLEKAINKLQHIFDEESE